VSLVELSGLSWGHWDGVISLTHPVRESSWVTLVDDVAVASDWIVLELSPRTATGFHALWVDSAKHGAVVNIVDDSSGLRAKEWGLLASNVTLGVVVVTISSGGAVEVESEAGLWLVVNLAVRPVLVDSAVSVTSAELDARIDDSGSGSNSDGAEG
jgi:hypothetical protein